MSNDDILKYFVPMVGVVVLSELVRSLLPQPTICCQLCGECFFTYERLYQHYTTAHPDEPVSVVWEYTNVECSAIPDPVAAWQRVILSATITNVGSKSITRTISEFWRRTLPVETDWYVINTNELTLVAGQAYKYNSSPNYIITMPGSTIEIYLIDSASYKSAVCRVSA